MEKLFLLRSMKPLHPSSMWSLELLGLKTSVKLRMFWRRDSQGASWSAYIIKNCWKIISWCPSWLFFSKASAALPVEYPDVLIVFYSRYSLFIFSISGSKLNWNFVIAIPQKAEKNVEVKNVVWWNQAQLTQRKNKTGKLRVSWEGKVRSMPKAQACPNDAVCSLSSVGGEPPFYWHSSYWFGSLCYRHPSLKLPASQGCAEDPQSRQIGGSPNHFNLTICCIFSPEHSKTCDAWVGWQFWSASFVSNNETWISPGKRRWKNYVSEWAQLQKAIGCIHPQSTEWQIRAPVPSSGLRRKWRGHSKNRRHC